MEERVVNTKSIRLDASERRGTPLWRPGDHCNCIAYRSSDFGFHRLNRLTTRAVGTQIFFSLMLAVNLAKSVFHVQRVEFLGFIFGEDTLEMESGKIQAIQDWEVPTRKKEV